MQDAAVLLAERYELGRVLGEGGMARVHLGLDRTLDRPVAINISRRRTTGATASSSGSVGRRSRRRA